VRAAVNDTVGLQMLRPDVVLDDHLICRCVDAAEIERRVEAGGPEDQRLAMVAALKPVDHAMLGDPTDMFLPIEKIRPDIITIGFNQMFDPGTLSRQLAERGLTPAIVRIGKFPGDDLCSSRLVVQRIITRRGTDHHHPGETGRES